MEFQEYRTLHEKLAGTPATLLAKAHLQMIRAAAKMEAARFVEPEDRTKPRQIEETDFGRQVVDELTWWVSVNAPRLDELSTRTRSAEEALQSLVEDARRLRDRLAPSTYAQLVDELAAWCERNAGAITLVHEFVEWLRTCGELGPSTLFTYRVWGTSRRSDRQLEPGADYTETPELLQVCSEWVLGLRGRSWLTVVHVAFDRIDAIAASLDPERHETPISVPYLDIGHRVAYDVLSRMVSHFELLRDSCRQLLGEVTRRRQLDSLLDDEVFWNRFLAEVVASGRTEEQWWDLKETLPIWHAAKDGKQQAEQHLCELVAAFANSEGGVLIVGITDSPPRRIVGLTDLENKVKQVLALIRSRTDLPDSAVRAKEILVSDGDGRTHRCLVIAVARSRHTVAVGVPGGQYTYPVRRGPGLERRAPAEVGESKRNLQAQDWGFMRHLAAVAGS